MLERVLAAGGMGEVYLARHLRLGVHRAIKVIREDQRETPTVTERFVREAQVLSRLQHNSIVQIVEFGELPSGWPFLVMEYVEGPNLDQIIDRLGRFAVTDALIVLEQIASALAYAHSQGVVHRDLKPANVLLRGGDVRQLKVIDFGLAQTMSAAVMSRLTAEGQILGSPLYMAPEQADGSLDLTGAVDVYALAGVAYMLLSGSPVFPGLSLVPLICAHATETPERLRARIPQAPELLDELMFSCLAKEPAARPRVDVLAAQLARLAGSAVEELHGGVGSLLDEATVLQLPSKLLGDGELAQLLSAPGLDDGVGESLRNQLVSLVGDIAAVLSAHDPDLARLLDAAHGISGELTDVEMEVAILEARTREAPLQTTRDALVAEQVVFVERAGALRLQLSEAQRTLAAKVDEMRAASGAQTAHLFEDIDAVVSQLRSGAS